MARLGDPELQALRTDITSTRADVLYNGKTLLTWWNEGNDQELANFYNQPHAPEIQVWNPAVPNNRFVEVLVMTEYLALTDAQRQGWAQSLLPQSIDMTLDNMRQSFATLFGGGSTTATDILDISRDPGTYGEILYSVVGGPPGWAM